MAGRPFDFRFIVPVCEGAAAAPIPWSASGNSFPARRQHCKQTVVRPLRGRRLCAMFVRRFASLTCGYAWSGLSEAMPAPQCRRGIKWLVLSIWKPALPIGKCRVHPSTFCPISGRICPASGRVCTVSGKPDKSLWPSPECPPRCLSLGEAALCVTAGERSEPADKSRHPISGLEEVARQKCRACPAPLAQA